MREPVEKHDRQTGPRRDPVLAEAHIPTTRPVVITHSLLQAVLTEAEARRRHGASVLLDDAGIARMTELLMDSVIADDLCFAVNTHSAPCWGSARPQTIREVIDSDAVYKSLVARFPRLPELFDAAEGHLIVVGGTVVDAITPGLSLDDRDEHTDLDMFIVGLEDEAATALLSRLLCILGGKSDLDKARAGPPIQAWDHEDEDQEETPERLFLRSDFQVSAIVGSDVYQFVLCKLASFAELLNLADVQCTGMGYAPSCGLVATPLAAFCFGAAITIVDPTQGSLAYDNRVLKYRLRGFAPVFPSLRPGSDHLADEFTLGRMRARRVEKDSTFVHKIPFSMCFFPCLGRLLSPLPLSFSLILPTVSIAVSCCAIP
jgi:hypothetical protein